MNEKEIEEIEVDLLLDAVFKRYGYDFREYSRASIKRRIKHFLAASSCKKISELTLNLLHSENFFQKLVESFSVTVTEMFRDPKMYKTLREKVIPYLKTYPFVKIWHAGCATGEEVYSLAIVLQEEGLYERSTVFATDLNEEALLKAKTGIYAMKNIRQFSENYQKAGGRISFSHYYHADYGSAAMSNSLKENITFARHNLATDHVFSEVHLVLCRNVLIYFKKPLQERSLNLFAESLIHDGFLCLGSKETLEFSNAKKDFSVLDQKMKIYRKKK